MYISSPGCLLETIMFSEQQLNSFLYFAMPSSKINEHCGKKCFQMQALATASCVALYLINHDEKPKATILWIVFESVQLFI